MKAFFLERSGEQFLAVHGWVKEKAHATRFPTGEDAARALADYRKFSPALVANAFVGEHDWRPLMDEAVHKRFNPFGFPE